MKINNESLESPVEIIRGIRGRTSSRRPEEPKILN